MSILLVVGVSCGSVVFLTLLTIFLVCYCQQRKKLVIGDSGDGMQTKVTAFPRPDKCQLHEMELKEECVLYRKTGFSGEPALIQEVGIPNDAADYS